MRKSDTLGSSWPHRQHRFTLNRLDFSERRALSGVWSHWRRRAQARALRSTALIEPMFLRHRRRQWTAIVVSGLHLQKPESVELKLSRERNSLAPAYWVEFRFQPDR